MLFFDPQTIVLAVLVGSLLLFVRDVLRYDLVAFAAQLQDAFNVVGEGRKRVGRQHGPKTLLEDGTKHPSFCASSRFGKRGATLARYGP